MQMLHWKLVQKISDRTAIKKVIVQGTAWASLLCTILVDKLGKDSSAQSTSTTECAENSDEHMLSI